MTSELSTCIVYAILPRFEDLHEHSPERVLILAPPSIAILAGATVSYLGEWRQSRTVLAAIAAAPAALAVALALAPDPYRSIPSRETTLLLVATSGGIVALFAISPSKTVRQSSLLALLVLLLWDPCGRILLYGFTDESKLESSLDSAFGSQTAAFLGANEPAAFLLARSAEQPGRNAGFDPTLLPDPATFSTLSPEIGYRGWHGDKGKDVNRLLIFNWGTWFRINDIQGYNPVQVERYVELVDALNGHFQEYHERDLFPGGLSSPLLDLLNLRFLVVSADSAETIAAAAPFRYLTVYADEHVRILENQDALPRAWLVHDARKVDAGQILPSLSDSLVDPRQTVLLETEPPRLDAAPMPDAERAAIVRYEPDQIELRVAASAPAILVLSEVWDPGWSATVDGQSAQVLLADYALRGVPIPQGNHTVILRYDPPLLRIGLVISAMTALLLVGAAIWSKSQASRGPKFDWKWLR